MTAAPASESGSCPRNTILVIGCSGHARVVLDIIAEEGRYRVMGLIDSYKPIGTELLGYEVVGREEDVRSLIGAGLCDGLLVAIGDNWVRGEMVHRLKELVPRIRFVNAVHPSARIARGVPIGCGTVIMPGTVVNTGSRIGEFCILNTSSSLDHDCTMEDYSSLAPRVVTGGSVRVGAYSVIGIGATVSHEITIGKHAVVGAGATVLRDVPERVVAYGTPARVIRNRQPGDPYLSGVSKARPEQGSPRPARDPQILRSLSLIPPSSPCWNSYVERTPHDFFHLAEYHALSEEFGGGEVWLAVFGTPEKFVAWPYILRDVSGGEKNGTISMRDVSSVYGYAGPICRCAENDSAFLHAASEAVLDAWRSQGAISAFTRFHPLLDNYTWLARGMNGEPPCVPDEPDAMGRTIAIDLRRSQQQIWDTYSRQLRQALRRSSSLALETHMDLDWSRVDALISLYYQTMRRNGASAFYYFPVEYFRRLKKALGSHGTIVVTCCEGTPAATGLLIAYGGIATMHLLATDDRFASVSPSKSLIHDAQFWAQQQGCHYLHLGGGRAGRQEDSLFRFKRMFSDATFSFHTGRWVLNSEAYEFLTRERKRNALALGYAGLAGAYFPSYRAPFVAAAPEASPEAGAPAELVTPVSVVTE